MMSTRMNWRLASRLSVITLAILVVLVVAVVQHNASQTSVSNSNASSSTSASNLQGTDLGSTPAPGFQLTDQHGKQISLAQFKGKPVVLAFMYTHCPDICPVAAERIHSAMLEMGSSAQKVGVLAVSTDPKRDNEAAAMQFTDEHNMQDYWHFLIGTQSQLTPVWSAYSIYAQAIQQTSQHTTAIYVIDKHGLERVYLDEQDFTPTELASDLQALLQEQ